jgi:hypothetical protein
MDETFATFTNNYKQIRRQLRRKRHKLGSYLKSNTPLAVPCIDVITNFLIISREAVAIMEHQFRGAESELVLDSEMNTYSFQVYKGGLLRFDDTTSACYYTLTVQDLVDMYSQDPNNRECVAICLHNCAPLFQRWVDDKIQKIKAVQ